MLTGDRGAAQKDPTRPGLALSEDGYGLVVGFPDAPVQVDFFTEPQCSHCAAVADRIAAGKTGVDVVEMDDTGFYNLFDADPELAGTPTIYDVNADEILDVYDDAWLGNLMESA